MTRKLAAFIGLVLVAGQAVAAPKFVEPELEIKQFKVPAGFQAGALGAGTATGEPGGDVHR